MASKLVVYYILLVIFASMFGYQIGKDIANREKRNRAAVEKSI